MFNSIVFRDDALGGMELGGSGGIARIDGIRKAAVPARVAASWTDGVTALGALTRYAMADKVPMEVVIGATTHGGGLAADPFSTTPFAPASPSALEQFAGDVAFVDRVLAGETIGRSIHYVVLGTETWKSTPVWPPAGVQTHALNLTPQGLSPAPATTATATHAVDPTSTSGLFNRWAAQRGKPIHYGDRRAAPGNRLSFDGAPMTADQELVGSAELCLVMQSDQTDGLVIAYLEDVAPDGRVTYLTEGLLRLLHRKTATSGCDAAAGVERSFAKADGMAVIPGETMQVELELLPVAARIQAGHHLRLSLAGADAGWFEPLTGAETATWTVHYGDAGSRLTVPLRPWSAE